MSYRDKKLTIMMIEANIHNPYNIIYEVLKHHHYKAIKLLIERGDTNLDEVFKIALTIYDHDHAYVKFFFKK